MTTMFPAIPTLQPFPPEEHDALKNQIAESLATLGRPIDGHKILSEAIEQCRQSHREFRERLFK
jgi:hypothetical protein